MAVKVGIWNDSTTKSEVSKRFRNAADARRRLESIWASNESAVYATGPAYRGSFSSTDSLQSVYNVGREEVDGGDSEANVSLVFKNFRFIHAQMSANPPSVVMRPQTSDQDDHRKADAADKVIRWAIRHYTMQERIDQLSLQALLYGTGVIKIIWDSSKGAIISYDKETQTAKMEGDITITNPFIWNIYIDPDAKTFEEARYVLEKIYMDYEDACLRWPDKEQVLKKALVTRSSNSARISAGNSNTQLQDEHYNSVELLEYWEPGLPANGYLGRYCITTVEGEVLEPCRPSPHRFKAAGAVNRIESDTDLTDEQKLALVDKLPEQASLPYHFLTDIDVPNSPWGKSAVEYAAPLQDNLVRLDSSHLENVRINGLHRLILPEAADLADDSITDDAVDVIKITGNQPPYYMSPPPLMQDMVAVRNNHIGGINDVMGTNESMFGQQSREQAAAAMQFATNQGNMVRRRIFNKYVLVVESIYRSILNLFRKHWEIPRMVYVLGKEKALDAIDLKGADIDGGYDVVGEYGVSLSLDPITRRQEVITLQPLFEKAGVPPQIALKMMKLSELEGLYDKLDLAGNRQKEIFDQMIATGLYIPPKKLRDHINMIAWALDYFMTSEFEMLPDEIQVLCEKHIEDRMILAAQEKTGTTPAPAAPPVPGVPL